MLRRGPEFRRYSALQANISSETCWETTRQGEARNPASNCEILLCVVLVTPIYAEARELTDRSAKRGVEI